jgi:phosphoribosyl-AMP cyclohydrolase
MADCAIDNIRDADAVEFDSATAMKYLNCRSVTFWAMDVSESKPNLAGLSWLDQVAWNEQGLVPAIAQEVLTGKVLMVAWMDRAALAETAATGRAVYFSRSRGKLWRKGEESGNVQVVKELRLDCDGDVILLKVTQQGGIACHTGREACFFSRLEDGQWQAVEPVLKDPKEIYGHE